MINLKKIRIELKNTTFQKTIKLTFLSIFSNLMVFLVPIFISYKYQISHHTDNFFLSYTIITFIAVIFSEAFKSVCIPFLKSKLSSKKTFDDFVSSIFYFIIKWLGITTFILGIFFLILYKLTDNELNWFLIISTPVFFLMIVNAFLSGILNSLDKFFIVEISTLIRGVIILLTMIIFNSLLGLSAAILGYILGELFKTIQLYLTIKKEGVQLRLNINSLDIIKPFLITGSYQIISSAISSSFPLISKTVASFLAIGSVSILDFGDRIFMVFNVLLNSFLIIILSKWSNDLKEGDFKIKNFHKTILMVFVISSFALFFVVIFNDNIISLLYPKINSNNRKLISLMLTLNMVGFVFNAVNQLINRATIASQGTHILIYNSIVKIFVNIILSIWFASLWGIIGIALSLVIVHIIGLIMNYLMFTSYILKYEHKL